ncbi:proton-conducting transporter membrane subunit [Croceicoccus sp. F390]|uniref:Proton-conducting transporter membrane subunit n=1 Tax=Croceicoccus esteveae TaxID=3075597 RepID=A0ABU2ZK69_9SPHN|nr:proton-conducting transporter membrane subunit [Croceicoccus sp. F390]MDT0575969.1 proton-conducting transporter membrane subunit [Croceicoccus sp. F390]
MPHSSVTTSATRPNDTMEIGTVVTGALWLGLAVMTLLSIAAAIGSVAITKLSLALGVLTLFVGAIAASFSARYMRADGHRQAFFLLMLALIGAVLAFLFAGNLIVLALAWLASGWLLARLIGHSSGWGEAQAASRRAAMSFIIGDTALVIALAILAWWSGSADLRLSLVAATLMPPALVTLVAALLLTAAAARCALPPFSGWLLSSMTAPTPVSALMHAGLVNAGGFLLIRFASVFEAAPGVRIAAVVLGAVAALYGIGIMMVRPDIKRSLAGSTVSQMGFMIMSCGLGAYAAALWHLIAHGLFKAWLFLGSGSAVGMKQPRAPVALAAPERIVIAGAILAVAIALASYSQIAGSLIPFLLGVATACAALAMNMRAKLTMKAQLTQALVIAGLIAFYVLGLLVAGLVVDANSLFLLPSWVPLAILVVFLAFWLWQQQILRNGTPLPPRLYIHLLNAGALPPASETAKNKGVPQ